MRNIFNWIKNNLFGSIKNTVLTVLVGWLLVSIVPDFLRWLVFDSVLQPAGLRDCIDADGACWAFIQDKWRIILFGTYPRQEQWRIILSIFLFVGLIIVSCIPAIWSTKERRRWMVAVWALGLGALFILAYGGLGLEKVAVRLWAGLPLTILLASVGMLFSFLWGIVLALGRRSSMPVVRWVCILFIELVRGVPLISLLFMGNFLFPLILPMEWVIPNLMRAQVAFIIFFSAYMAEIVRGGLQAVPKGQYAAAKAIGLTFWQAMIWIIMPQALRIVIPALVNLFIAAFKDTTLVMIIGMFDLLGTANLAKADPKWWGLFVEAYFFIAVIYLIVCASMSWYSRYLERRASMATR